MIGFAFLAFGIPFAIVASFGGRLADRRGAAPAVPGSGLGLSIAQALVQRMGRQIELHDGENGMGLAACVRLPRAL